MPRGRRRPRPILRTGIYDGEDYDARLELTGWSNAGFDDEGWDAVAVRDRDPNTLVAPTAPPVRCTEEVRPVAVLTSPTGARILDFGQNLVGRVRIRVEGPAGSTVRIRTSEVLQDGEVYTRPLREARSTDHYTLAGRAGGEEWEPRFTFHGFRYAEIDGWTGDIDADAAAGDLVARVYHTDLERTGWFESSDPLVNRLHENVVWGMRGNFVDIPTDCPQRDERVGWTGDIQVFAPTASFLFDASGMLSGWLRDVEAEQLPDGTIPWYVPVIPAHEMWTPIRPGAAWGDVATLTPWTLYERFGDAGILAAQFDSARRWVDLVSSIAGPDRLWNTGFQLGDWLDPAAPPQDPADAATDRYLVATAYFAKSARTVARMAAVLGRTDDEAHYVALADEIDSAFAAEYVLPDGRDDQRRPDGVRPRDRVRPDSGCRAARVRRAAPGRTRARGAEPHRDRVRRHAARLGRSHPDRAPRQGLRPPARAGLPVVAVPGRHGCDHRLGALGQPAARRRCEPRHDDFVQPLRTGRRRRLAAPRRRRARTGRSRLSGRALRAAAGRWPHLGVRPAPHSLR